jgi:hypothetical protein
MLHEIQLIISVMFDSLRNGPVRRRWVRHAYMQARRVRGWDGVVFVHATSVEWLRPSLLESLKRKNIFHRF